jgi:hypothetical protein
VQGRTTKGLIKHQLCKISNRESLLPLIRARMQT